MSKSKPQKVSLGQFIQETGGVSDSMQLPDAPRGGDDSGMPGRSGADRWGARGSAAGGGDRGDRAGGGRRRYDDNDEEMPPKEDEGPSRADEADQWRRAGPATRGGDRAGAGSGFGRRDDPRGPPRRDDEEGGWGRRGGDAPPRSDDASEWRNARPSAGPGPSRFGGDREDRGGRFGGDRDRGFGDRERSSGGFGDRERGGFGDRERGSGGGFGDRPSSGSRFGDRSGGGFGDRDRSSGGGFGDRDRGGGFGSRFGGDRDRDRGFGDRERGGFGDRDRGFGDRDRGFGGGRGGFDRDRRPEPTNDRWREPERERDAPSNKSSTPRSNNQEETLADRFDNAVKVSSSEHSTDSPRKTQTESSSAEPKENAEPAAPVEPPAPKPVKTKVLDPNQKLNPFGAAGPAAAKDKDAAPSPLSTKPAASASTASAAAPVKPLSSPASSGAAGVYRPRAMREQEKEVEREKEKEREFNSGPVPTPVDVAPHTEAKKNPAFDAAMQSGAAVTQEQLLEGLKALNIGFNDKALQTQLTTVLANSIAEGTVTFTVVIDALVAKSKFHSNALIKRTLETLHTKGDAVILNAVRASNVDVGKYFVPVPKELQFLKPGNVSEDLKSAFTSGKSAEDVLKLLKSSSEEKRDANEHASGIAGLIFREVFADKASPKLVVMETYAPVLKFVAPSVSLQIEVMVAAHVAWAAAGLPKGAIKTVFTKLKTLEVLSDDSIIEWKDDVKSKSAEGKKQALVQVMPWIQEIENARAAQNEEEFDEEDLDDPEDEDEYARGI